MELSKFEKFILEYFLENGVNYIKYDHDDECLITKDSLYDFMYTKWNDLMNMNGEFEFIEEDQFDGWNSIEEILSFSK